MSTAKDEQEGGTKRATRNAGIDKSQVLSVSSRAHGRVALRSDRTTFRRTLRERKENKVPEEDINDCSLLCRKPPKATQGARKRVHPAGLADIQDRDGADSPIMESYKAGGACASGEWKHSNIPGTPTPRSSWGFARSTDFDTVGDEWVEVCSPSWSYLEGTAEEMASSSLPHAAPVITKVKMAKLLQALCTELFSTDGEEGKAFDHDAGLVEMKASLLHRVAVFQYRSWYVFRSDFDGLMRKYCASTEPGIKEAAKSRMVSILTRYRALCGEDLSSSAGTRRIGDHATLTQIRDDLCENLRESDLDLGKPEDSAVVFQAPSRSTPEVVAAQKPKKKRIIGLGKGKRPVKPPYHIDRLPPESDEEAGDESAVAEPLVISKQPPSTFVSGMYGGKDHHFEVEVRVPEAMRKRMILESAVPLVVELRYEDGEAADQQPLQVLEEPLMYPGMGKWVVKATINATSFKHGKRRFALWLDVSQFDQRGHNLHVQGVLTEGVTVVSSGVMAPAPKKRKAS